MNVIPLIEMRGVILKLTYIYIDMHKQLRYIWMGHTANKNPIHKAITGQIKEVRACRSSISNRETGANYQIMTPV